MGISTKTAIYLLRQAQQRSFSGEALTFGVQDFSATGASLHASAVKAGIERRFLSKLAQLPRAAAPTDREFFKILGFSDLHRTDVSTYEGAEFILDLNSSGAIPEDRIGRYGMVFDGGTMEHVFHVPNVLENVHRLLRVGGTIVHLNPASNYVDHGFYSFSPTFYTDYYARNGYANIQGHLVRHTRNYENEDWTFGVYEPGILDAHEFGGLDSAMYVNFFAAEKTEASTSGLVPQQGRYWNFWAGAEPGDGRGQQRVAPSKILRPRKVRRVLSGWLYAAADAVRGPKRYPTGKVDPH